MSETTQKHCKTESASGQKMTNGHTSNGRQRSTLGPQSQRGLCPPQMDTGCDCIALSTVVSCSEDPHQHLHSACSCWKERGASRLCSNCMFYVGRPGTRQQQQSLPSPPSPFFFVNICCFKC